MTIVVFACPHLPCFSNTLLPLQTCHACNIKRRTKHRKETKTEQPFSKRFTQRIQIIYHDAQSNFEEASADKETNSHGVNEQLLHLHVSDEVSRDFKLLRSYVLQRMYLQVGGEREYLSVLQAEVC